MGGFGTKRVQVMDTSGTLSMVIMACVGQGIGELIGPYGIT